MNGKLVAQNKKARHDFFFEEIIEAGIVLTGTEIKSVRAGGISLRDSFAKIESGEVWAYGVNISPYEQGNRYNTEPLRPKKLLLHKDEIRKINSCTYVCCSLLSDDFHHAKRYLKSGRTTI